MCQFSNKTLFGKVFTKVNNGFTLNQRLIKYNRTNDTNFHVFHFDSNMKPTGRYNDDTYLLLTGHLNTCRNITCDVTRCDLFVAYIRYKYVYRKGIKYIKFNTEDIKYFRRKSGMSDDNILTNLHFNFKLISPTLWTYIKFNLINILSGKSDDYIIINPTCFISD